MELSTICSNSFVLLCMVIIYNSKETWQLINRTEMIYSMDQDEMRRKTITQIHSDNPCTAGGCEGTGKGLLVN